MNQTKVEKFNVFKPVLVAELIILALWAFAWLKIRFKFDSIINGVVIFVILFLIFIGVVFIVFHIKANPTSKKETVCCIISISISVAIMLAIATCGIILIVQDTKAYDALYDDYYNKKGDFSDYTCCECDNPANGGTVKLMNYDPKYYCSKHYEEYMEKIKEREDREKYQRQCEWCEKWFENGSVDGKNIAVDGMCIDCEVSLRNIADAYD